MFDPRAWPWAGIVRAFSACGNRGQETRIAEKYCPTDCIGLGRVVFRCHAGRMPAVLKGIVLPFDLLVGRVVCRRHSGETSAPLLWVSFSSDFGSYPNTETVTGISGITGRFFERSHERDCHASLAMTVLG